MDKVSIANPGQEIVDFGGLQMRPLATVPLSLITLLGGLRRHPYSEQTVRRTTVYVYEQGREVYELLAPDGTTYLMQSYSLQVEPTLRADDLPALSKRLQLPDGWSYRARRLTAEWALGVDGEAHLVQDELENSHQRVEQSSSGSDGSSSSSARGLSTTLSRQRSKVKCLTQRGADGVSITRSGLHAAAESGFHFGASTPLG